jgi:hypothetical protein
MTVPEGTAWLEAVGWIRGVWACAPEIQNGPANKRAAETRANPLKDENSSLNKVMFSDFLNAPITWKLYLEIVPTHPAGAVPTLRAYV